MTRHADAGEKGHDKATKECKPERPPYAGVSWRNAVNENERGTEKSE